jgi:hypothetical protein
MSKILAVVVVTLNLLVLQDEMEVQKLLSSDSGSQLNRLAELKGSVS